MAIAVIIGLSAVFGVPTKTIAWSESLNCGQCIMGGYNFCMQAYDGVIVQAGGSLPTSKCCVDNQCPEVNITSWSCSSTYSNVSYALTFCPQEQSKCGTTQHVQVPGEGSKVAINSVTDLLAG